MTLTDVIYMTNNCSRFICQIIVKNLYWFVIAILYLKFLLGFHLLGYYIVANYFFYFKSTFYILNTIEFDSTFYSKTYTKRPSHIF